MTTASLSPADHRLLSQALDRLVPRPSESLGQAISLVAPDCLARHEAQAAALEAGLDLDACGPDLCEALAQALALRGDTVLVPPPPVSEVRPVAPSTLHPERRVAILMAEALDAQARAQALMQQAHGIAQDSCGVSFREIVARTWGYTGTALRNVQATVPVVERAAQTVERKAAS